MTKSLQEAFTVVSMNFSRKEQERFAHLIMENIGRLREFLEKELEERSFDRIAVETIKSPKIQNFRTVIITSQKVRKFLITSKWAQLPPNLLSNCLLNVENYEKKGKKWFYRMS